MSISSGWLTKKQSPFHPPCRHSKLPRSPASSLPGSRGHWSLGDPFSHSGKWWSSLVGAAAQAPGLVGPSEPMGLTFTTTRLQAVP